MKQYTVVFAPEARELLAETVFRSDLANYVATNTLARSSTGDTKV